MTDHIHPQDKAYRACRSCCKVKPVGDFYMSKRDGISLDCKECKCARDRSIYLAKHGPRPTPQERLWSLVIPVPESGCWLFLGGEKRNGYGRMMIGGRSHTLSRASYELFYGPIPQGMCVCHKCDTPQCANPKHLFLGTHRDNVIDMISKGRDAIVGSRSHRAITLCQTDIDAIKVSSDSHDALAGRYEVSRGTIYNIKHGLHWSNAA